MTTLEFFEQLDARVAKYDLLCHPFYKSWSEGKLTRDDLREYAKDYFHHVEAFPSYLGSFANRLENGGLRKAVLANKRDEEGIDLAGNQAERSHADLWLDFAEGMGAERDLAAHAPLPEIAQLIGFFERMANEAAPEEALAAFYAYESQVPRVAQEKARGLREMYNSDEKTCSYFTLHATADIYHSQVWKQQLARQLADCPQNTDKALDAAEAAAKALWNALDGIEARRTVLAA